MRQSASYKRQEKRGSKRCSFRIHPPICQHHRSEARRRLFSDTRTGRFLLQAKQAASVDEADTPHRELEDSLLQWVVVQNRRKRRKVGHRPLRRARANVRGRSLAVTSTLYCEECERSSDVSNGFCQLAVQGHQWDRETSRREPLLEVQHEARHCCL